MQHKSQPSLLISASLRYPFPPLQSGSSLKQPTRLFINAQPFATARARLSMMEGITKENNLKF
jgi:hypothetical protein